MSTAPLARHGRIVRASYLCIASCVACAARAHRQHERRVVVCYHGVHDAQADAFARQLTVLSQKKGTLPAQVALTFDDGFENVLRNAVPVLMEVSIPATVFVVAGNVGRMPRWDMPATHPDRQERLLNWDQLRQLSYNPLIEIGSHTMTHRRLADLDSSALGYELVQSRRVLERQLRCPVAALALPHGSYNEQVIAMAKEAGYSKIYTLEERVIEREAQQTGVLGRFVMSPDAWPIEFMLTCAGAYRWLYPWRRVVRGVRRVLNYRGCGRTKCARMSN